MGKSRVESVPVEKSAHTARSMAPGFIACLMIIGCSTPLWTATGAVQCESSPRARNIILMVADGMGLSNVTAARIYKGGAAGRPLSFEKLPVVGYQRTYSRNSTITDSAAAASAWACGRKFRNGEICCDSLRNDCSASSPTIMELAIRQGRVAGLVATAAISQATTAAFVAHVHSRFCEGEIARQMLEVPNVLVLLGGGWEIPSAREKKICVRYGRSDGQELLDLAKRKGYGVVRTKEELLNFVAKRREVKILGQFSRGDKAPENFRLSPHPAYPPGEPTLAEMTAAALEHLRSHPSGFFLLVEGSLIDKANHKNRFAADNGNGREYAQLAEVLAFEAAVSVVLEQLDSLPGGGDETLLIVTSDHDTGGFSITGPRRVRVGRGVIPETAWSGRGHTAVDTLVWSRGPGSCLLSGPLENTDLYRVMGLVLGGGQP